MLLRCLEARAPLYRALALAHSSPSALRTGGGGGGPLHPAVRAAAYRCVAGSIRCQCTATVKHHSTGASGRNCCNLGFVGRPQELDTD